MCRNQNFPALFYLVVVTAAAAATAVTVAVVVAALNYQLIKLNVLDPLRSMTIETTTINAGNHSLTSD